VHAVPEVLAKQVVPSFLWRSHTPLPSHSALHVPEVPPHAVPAGSLAVAAQTPAKQLDAEVQSFESSQAVPFDFVVNMQP